MIKVLVAESVQGDWDYKIIEVESESEFEYQVLTRKTRSAMVEYVGKDDWYITKDVDGLVETAFEIDPTIPVYVFGSSNDRATFTKLYKGAELFSVFTCIENERIADYSEK